MLLKKTFRVLPCKREEGFKNKINRSCGAFNIQKNGANLRGVKGQSQAPLPELSSSFRVAKCKRVRNIPDQSRDPRRSPCSAASSRKYLETTEWHEYVFPGTDQTSAMCRGAPAANPPPPP